jgi:hypothetical protein
LERIGMKGSQGPDDCGGQIGTAPDWLCQNHVRRNSLLQVGNSHLQITKTTTKTTTANFDHRQLMGVGERGIDDVTSLVIGDESDA